MVKIPSGEKSKDGYTLEMVNHLHDRIKAFFRGNLKKRNFKFIFLITFTLNPYIVPYNMFPNPDALQPRNKPKYHFESVFARI